MQAADLKSILKKDFSPFSNIIAGQAHRVDQAHSFCKHVNKHFSQSQIALQQPVGLIYNMEH